MAKTFKKNYVPTYEEYQKSKKLKPVKTEDVPISDNSGVGVRFNPDKSVDVQLKGTQANKLSQEEFKGFQDKAGGLQTGRVTALTEAQKLIQGIKSQQKQNQMMASPEQLISSQEVGEFRTPELEAMEKQAQTKLPKKVFGVEFAEAPKELLDKAQSGSAIERIGAKAEIKRLQTQAFVNNVFALVDTAKSFLGDTENVKDARQMFTKSNQAFDEIIDKVATGEVSEGDAARILNRAVSNNVQLAANTKRKGLDNVRYWGQKGLDLEEEVENNRVILEGKRAKLVAAIATKNANMMVQSNQLNTLENVGLDE